MRNFNYMKTFTILGTLTFIFLTGCATQYQGTGFSGGFKERQTARNEFTVAFAGNGYTSGQRAIDLCMLRCAELTLGHGFHYFILTANNSAYDTSSAVTVGNYVPTGYGSGVFLSTTQTIPKPTAANRILCFRVKPAATTKCFDAQNVFDALSQKYGVHKQVETFHQLYPSLQFKQISDVRLDGVVSEKDVTIVEGHWPTIVAFPVAQYVDFENPFDSIEELKQTLVKAAVDNGANGVHILNSPEEVKNVFPNAPDLCGCLCALLVIPKAHLGVEYESGTGYEKRRIVRRILRQDADTIALHIGDNVLAINGIDPVLSGSDSMKDCLKWNIGQEVQVTVARDGKELTFPVKTVENRLQN
jgi:hypothetical protein